MTHCPKCQSSEIIAAVPVDEDHNNIDQPLRIARQNRPEALLFKQMRTTTLSVKVCAGCGYTEFYATDPHALTAI